MLTKIQKNTLFVVTFAILGLLLRFYHLEERFNFDAELNVKAWTIQKLVVNHQIPLVGIEAVSYLHHLFYPPLFQFIGALLFFIANLNPLAMEIFLILLFLPSVFVIFKLGTVLSGKLAAYVAVIIYSVSFFVNLASRFIWVVGPMLFISLLILFVIMRIYAKPRTLKNYLYLGTLLGIGFNFHYQTFILFFSTLIWILLLRKNIPVFKAMALLMLPVMVAFLPLVIFDLRHDFFNLRGILLLISSNKTNSFLQNLLNANGSYVKPLASVFSIRLAEAINPVKYAVLLLLINIFTLFSPLALYLRTKARQRETFLFIFLNFLFAFVALPFVQNRFYGSQYYLYFLIPYWIILLSFIFKWLYEKKQYLFLAAISLLFFYENLFMYKTYELRPNYKTKITALEKILRKKLPLVIYSEDIPSERYSYLLYYLAKRNNINYDLIKIYEPWQPVKHWTAKINRKLFE